MTAHGHRGFEPVPDNSKATVIVDRLITAIAAGDFLPGSRLPSERALAESLAVGRNTVRSALKELAERRFIEIRRGRSGGAFVLRADAESSRESLERVFGHGLADLEQAIDAIALGYALAAETAAMRRSRRDLDEIAAALSHFSEAVEAHDPRAAQTADAAFHRAIIDATGQPALHGVIRDLDRTISLGAPMHVWGSTDQHEAMHERALRDHRAIYEAIADGDRRAAFDRSYSHATIDFDLIVELLGSQ